MVQRDETGEEKSCSAAEGREPFLWMKKRRESNPSGMFKKALPLKAATEKVKTSTDDCTRKLFPKTIDKGKRSFTPDKSKGFQYCQFCFVLF